MQRTWRRYLLDSSHRLAQLYGGDFFCLGSVGSSFENWLLPYSNQITIQSMTQQPLCFYIQRKARVDVFIVTSPLSGCVGRDIVGKLSGPLKNVGRRLVWRRQVDVVAAAVESSRQLQGHQYFSDYCALQERQILSPLLWCKSVFG